MQTNHQTNMSFMFLPTYSLIFLSRKIDSISQLLQNSCKFLMFVWVHLKGNQKRFKSFKARSKLQITKKQEIKIEICILERLTMLQEQYVLVTHSKFSKIWELDLENICQWNILILNMTFLWMIKYYDIHKVQFYFQDIAQNFKIVLQY